MLGDMCSRNKRPDRCDEREFANRLDRGFFGSIHSVRVVALCWEGSDLHPDPCRDSLPLQGKYKKQRIRLWS